LASLGLVVPSENLGLLRFEQLVGIEERLDFPKPVIADLLERLHVVISGIVDRNSKDLEVGPLFVGHVETAKHFCLDHAARKGRLLDKNEDIEVIAILGKRIRDETVVGWIMDRGVEDAIELEHATFFVVLVLVARSPWNLDERQDGALV
jgi:hypothetical protein